MKKDTKIYHDFQKVDNDRCLILTLNGTLQDLKKNNIQLSEGLRLTFYDDGIEAGGIVRFNSKIKEWVAEIDWTKIRHV